MTEDELDIWGVVPVNNTEIKEPQFEIKNLSEDSIFFRGMTTCHSLLIINGNLAGDPLDIKVSILKK